MKSPSLPAILRTAVDAAQLAGGLMRANLTSTSKRINEASQHDIKLELDVHCQKLIEKRLRKSFPAIPVLGEEGETGDSQADYRWVVDPIDGTVNFAYGIPHACVSIALDRRWDPAWSSTRSVPPSGYETQVGVVYDPFSNELWTAIRGKRACLNGRTIRVSSRSRLEESIVSMGFAKHPVSLDAMLPVFNGLVREVRKMRIMGAAALAMVYVASGRLEAYLEHRVRWWDIAAGGLILECAGGEFSHVRIPEAASHTYRVIASNGHVNRKISRRYKF
ncbi:MAG: inositol monophosphatase [Verrucomicrobia bacterium]|nr:inositol monophosphatase [Verrucomicrobiota bacterium]